MANGIRIHYWRTGGDKPPLIMAHGYSDDGLCWTNLATDLTGDWDIILPDARGHGFSDPPPREDEADSQVEDLAGIIKALKLEKPVLMGHSMGSASVAWFAARYPDVPRAIVLEDPRLVGTYPDRDDAAVQRRVAQIVQRNNSSYEELLAQCLERNGKWERSECEYWVPSKIRHHPFTAHRRLGARPAMGELFPKITCPTLILKADDKPDLKAQNEKVAALLRHGQLAHIEGAGHSVRRDQEARLLAVLRPFLEGL